MIKSIKCLHRFLLPAIIVCILQQTILIAKPNADELDKPKHSVLLQFSLNELMDIEVEVTSKRLEPIQNAPGVVTVISKEEIELFGARNLFDVLNKMPNVYGSGSYLFPNSVVSVRGDLDSHVDNRVLILINGRPLRDSNFGGQNFSIYRSYPVTMIERVEMIRGPGSVLYGSNAFTGVINIITKNGNNEHNQFKLSGGSHGNYIFESSIRKSTDNYDYIGVVNISGEDGWEFNATDFTGSTDHQRRGFESGTVTANFKIGTFAFDFFGSKTKTDNIGILPLWSLPGQKLNSERLFGNMTHNQKLSDNWTLSSNVTVNYMDTWWAAESIEHKSTDILGEMTIMGNVSDNLDFLTGVSIEHQSGSTLNNSPVPKYRRLPLRIYSEAGYKLNDQIKLIGGLQWNKPEDDDGDILNRLGLIINLNRFWSLKFLRGEAYRAPNPTETDILVRNGNFTILSGNSALEPEKITTYDAQLYYQGESAQFGLTYFDSKLENLIVRVPTEGNGQSFNNGGNSDFWGLEIEGKYNFPHGLFSSSSVTYQDSRDSFGTRPSVVPHLMIKFGIGYKNRKFSLGVFDTYISDPEPIAGAPQLNLAPDGYHWITVNCKYDITDWIGLKKGNAKFTLQVTNLLDKDVNHPDWNGRLINSLPQDSGITVYSGFEFNF